MTLCAHVQEPAIYIIMISANQSLQGLESWKMGLCFGGETVSLWWGNMTEEHQCGNLLWDGAQRPTGSRDRGLTLNPGAYGVRECKNTWKKTQLLITIFTSSLSHTNSKSQKKQKLKDQQMILWWAYSSCALTITAFSIALKYIFISTFPHSFRFPHKTDCFYIRTHTFPASCTSYTASNI